MAIHRRYDLVREPELDSDFLDADFSDAGFAAGAESDFGVAAGAESDFGVALEVELSEDRESVR